MLQTEEIFWNVEHNDGRIVAVLILSRNMQTFGFLNPKLQWNIKWQPRSSVTARWLSSTSLVSLWVCGYDRVGLSPPGYKVESERVVWLWITRGTTYAHRSTDESPHGITKLSTRQSSTWDLERIHWELSARVTATHFCGRWWKRTAPPMLLFVTSTLSGRGNRGKEEEVDGALDT